VPTPVVVLTPNLSGRDGVSRLARLATGAFDEAIVIALHEPAAPDGRAARARRRPRSLPRGQRRGRRCPAWWRCPHHRGGHPPAPGACRPRLRGARRLARDDAVRRGGVAAGDVASTRGARSRRAPGRDLTLHPRALPRGQPRAGRTIDVCLGSRRPLAPASWPAGLRQHSSSAAWRSTSATRGTTS
jgi:hypothetical protein